MRRDEQYGKASILHVIQRKHVAHVIIAVLTRECGLMHPDTPGPLSQSRSCCHCHLVGGSNVQFSYEHTGTGRGDVGDCSRVPQ